MIFHLNKLLRVGNCKFFWLYSDKNKTKQTHKQKNKTKQWVINNTSRTTLLQLYCFTDCATTYFIYELLPFDNNMDCNKINKQSELWNLNALTLWNFRNPQHCSQIRRHTYICKWVNYNNFFNYVTMRFSVSLQGHPNW